MERLEEQIASLGRWIDEAFVGFSFLGRPREAADREDVRERMAEAQAFFACAEVRARLFRSPPAVDPAARLGAALPGGATVDLSWPSTYEPVHASHAATLARFPDNGTCRARWLRHHTRRPAVIMLHGWGGGFFAVDATLLRASWLYARGLDVVLLQAPFHASRAAVARLLPPMFPSYARPIRTTEAFAQSIADARTLAGLLRRDGAPAVGAFGLSLGGFTAALLATAEPDLDFLVAAIPFATLPDLAWSADEPTAPPAARALGVPRETFAGAFAAVDPLSRPPAMPASRVAVVYGLHDRVTPPAHAERLHRHFPGSRLVPFPGSHLLQWGRQAMFSTLVAMAREASEGAPVTEAARAREAS